MKRRAGKAVLSRPSLLIMAAALMQPAAAENFAFHAEHVLGTSLDMQIETTSQSSAELAWFAARSEINRLEALFSTWRDDSEISRLNRERRGAISRDSTRLLERCAYWLEETEGAVDCRFGNVITAWAQAAQTGHADLESVTRLAMAARDTDIHLSGVNAVIQGDASLKVDALAKGMIIDAAMNAARAASPDARAILLDIGGDMRVDGVFAEAGVRVGVAGPGSKDNTPPIETLLLRDAAIATSGTSARDLVIAGRPHSHIISPFTGRPQDNVEIVTVVAPTAETADALATAFAVSGVGVSLGYANSHEGVEVMIITKGGARFTSDGWASLRAPIETVTAEEAGVDNPWPDDWRLEVAYEIQKYDVGDYEYPYVVAWVTDTDNRPVRHLLMLGDSPRWMEENYVHWRRVGRKNPAIADHVARPTRPPGRYDLVWDGYDDQGRPVKKGDYVLHVEASREHGGHQYEKIPLNLTDRPMSHAQEAGSELGAIQIAFGPKADGA